MALDFSSRGTLVQDDLDFSKFGTLAESEAPDTGDDLARMVRRGNDVEQPEQQVVTSARAWRGADAGRGSFADPRRLDSEGGQRLLAVEDEINKLEKINPKTREELRPFAEYLVDTPKQPFSPVDRAQQYLDKGYSAKDAEQNAAFDSSLEQRLNKPFEQAQPDKRITIGYNPNTEAERVAAEVKEQETLRSDFYQRQRAEELPDFVRGLGKGVIQGTGLLAGTVGYVGDVIGDDEMKAWGLDKYQDMMRQTANVSVAKNFTDIQSASDAATWFSENMGYVALQAAQSLLAGGVGGAVASTIGKKALGEAVGMGVANMAQTFGSVYGEAAEEAKRTGKEPDLMKVAIGATMSAAIDTVADKMGLDAVTAKGFKGNIMQRGMKSVGTQMGVQGGTEALQLIPETAGAGKDPFGKGMAEQYLNEAAVGALGGAGPGVAGAIPNRANYDAVIAERAKLESLRALKVDTKESVKQSDIENIGAATSVDEAIAAAKIAGERDADQTADDILSSNGIDTGILKPNSNSLEAYVESQVAAVSPIVEAIDQGAEVGTAAQAGSASVLPAVEPTESQPSQSLTAAKRYETLSAEIGQSVGRGEITQEVATQKIQEARTQILSEVAPALVEEAIKTVTPQRLESARTLAKQGDLQAATSLVLGDIGTQSQLNPEQDATVQKLVATRLESQTNTPSVEIPQSARYELTQSPVGGVEPLSQEDADFELEVLETRASKGKLTPEVFAASEVGKRLKTATLSAINTSLAADPVGTIQSLRSQVSAQAPAQTSAATDTGRVWTGRSADGYATQEEAQNAIPRAQDRYPDANFVVTPTADGRFVLKDTPTPQEGVATEQPGVVTYATQMGRVAGPAPVARSAERVQEDADAVLEFAVNTGKAGTAQAPIPVSDREIDVRLGTSGTLVKAVAAVAESAFGTKVTFVKAQDNYFGAASGGRVFINLPMAAVGDRKNSFAAMAIATIGHEAGHAGFEQTAEGREIDKAYRGVVEQHLKEGVLGKYEASFKIDQTTAASEVMRDVDGAMWVDPKFWSRLYDIDNGSTFRKIAYKFMQAATKFISAAKGSRLDIDTLVSNVEAVREAAAQAWAAKAQGAKTIPRSKLKADLFSAPAYSQTGDQNEILTGRDGGVPANAGQDGSTSAGNGGDRPNYGQPREGAVSVVGRHYSKGQRTTLSGLFYGQGLKGAESKRLEGASSQIRSRVYFYVDTGKGIRPESGVGGYAHEVRLDNIYDPATKLIPPQASSNAFEEAVVKAGFDGWIDRNFTTTNGAVVLLGTKHGAVPVRYVQDAANAPSPVSEAPSTIKKGLLSKEANAVNMDAIPGAKMRMGTLEVPADQRDAANAEMERIGSDVRYSRSNFEVAPDPNDIELSGKWNALPLQKKLAVSRLVAESIVPRVLFLAGATGKISDQFGSYLADTNPSFALTLDSGNVHDVSKKLGYVLSQDSMMNISLEPFDGSEEVGAIVIAIGDKSFDEVKAIYDQIRAAVPDVGGQSFVGGEMIVLNYSNTPTDELAVSIDASLGSEYPTSTKQVYASFPKKEEYGYGSGTDDTGARGGVEGVVRQRLDSLRGEATRIITSEVSYSRANQGGVLDGVRTGRANGGRGVDGRGNSSGAIQASERAIAPLKGYPHGQVKGAAGPDQALNAVAEQYAKRNGIELKRQAEYVAVDPDRAKRIAAAYEAMVHAPQDPKVKEAYENLIQQTKAQYDALVDAGYSFWFIDISTPEGQDYASTPWNAMRDVRANKRMGVFPTAEGFGSGATDLDVSDNPLLADTGLTWPSGGPDGQAKPVLANDLFRAVHDAFGHGLEGAGFRAQGEENAWQAHVRLFTGSAVAAITSETRGQNSWLNFGPYGEKNQTAKAEDTVFADQKIGLLPEWAWTEGVSYSRADEYEDGFFDDDTEYNEDAVNLAADYEDVPDSMPEDLLAELDDIGMYIPGNPLKGYHSPNTPEFRRWFKDSQWTNEDGTPMVGYHGTAQAIESFRAKQAGAIFVAPDPKFTESYLESSSLYMRKNYEKFLTEEQVKKVHADVKKQIMAIKGYPMSLRREMRDQVGTRDNPEVVDMVMAEVEQYMPSGPNIIPVWVSVQNPFDFEQPGDVRLVAGKIKPVDGKVNVTLIGGEQKTLTEQDFRRKLTAGDWEIIESPEVMSVIRELGFDGILVSEMGRKNVAVFEPTQIKSVFNNGNFDPQDKRISFSRAAGPKEFKFEDNYLVPEVEGAFDDDSGNIAVMPAIQFAKDGIKRYYPSMPVRIRVGQHGLGGKQYGLQHRIDNQKEQPSQRGYVTPVLGDDSKSVVERAVRDITLGVLDSQTAYADNAPTKIYLHSPTLNVSTVLEKQKDSKEKEFWSVVTSMPSTREQMVRRYKAPTSVFGLTLNGDRSQQSVETQRGILNKLREPGRPQFSAESYIVDEDGRLFKGQEEKPIVDVVVKPRRTLARDENGKIILNKAKTSYSRSEQSTPDKRESQISSPEFRAWFKDSKAVDADGKPLVVYHGTMRDFTEFSKKGVRPNFNSPQKQIGFFFTDDPTYADRYTQRWGEFKDGANTMPVYLSLQNPKIEPIENIGEIEDRMKQGEAKAYRAELEAQGYDGIVFEGETPIGFVREFVAFNPTQIKSVFNSGNFDPANPDIRYSRSQDLLNDGESFYDQYRNDRANGRRITDDGLIVALSGADKKSNPRWGYVEARGSNDGEVTAFWNGSLAGKDGYHTSAVIWGREGGRKFIMPMFPAGELASGSKAEVQQAIKAGNYAWYLYAVEESDGSWTVGNDGAEPGQKYFDKLNELGQLIPVRKGHHRLTPPVGTNEWDLLREGARRLSMALDGKTPALKFKRETGANPDKPGATLSPERVEVRFSRTQPLQGQNFTIPGEGFFAKQQRLWQDYFAPVKAVQDAILKGGGSITEASDVYKAEERMYGRVEEVLRDFRDKHFTPMIERATELDITPDEIALYAYAKHAPERNAHIATINKRFPDGGSGMTNAEAAAIIAKAKQEGKFTALEELHTNLMAITQGTRQEMLVNELITQDEFDALDGMFENYVPLRGLAEDVDEPVRRGGGGYNIKGKETIRALGRKTKAKDIMENIVNDYERAVSRGEKNLVGQTFLELIRRNPDPDLWEIDAVRTKQAWDRQKQKVKTVSDVDSGPDTVAVKVKGREVYIKIHDENLLRAMRKAYKTETSGIERFLTATLGGFNNMLRATLTQYNPVFGFVNWTRDFQMGAVGVADELGFGAVGSFTANQKKAMGAANRYVNGKLDISNPVDKLFQEFRMAGATTGGFYAKDAEHVKSEIRNIMLAAGAKPVGFVENVKTLGGTRAGKVMMRGVSGVGSVLEHFGLMTENATRFAAYMTARENGKTPAQAASIAKNLTTNFNRKGEYGQAMNAAYLFFNAAVQGSARVAQALKNKKILGLAAGLVGSGAMLAAMAVAVGGDDDDGQAYWDKIPDFEKERNFIIMLPPGYKMDGAETIGKDGRYIKIPMPYGFSVFPVLGYVMHDVARHQQDKTTGVSAIKGAARMTSAVMGSFNPFGGAFDPSDSTSVMMAAAPTAADVVIQQAMGVNAFGRKTAPFKGEFDTDPDSENVNPRQAGSVYHMIARGLNYATGGDEAQSGAIDVAPGSIENAVKTITGGTGTFMTDVFVNLPVKVFDASTGADAEITKRDLPLIRNFLGDVDGMNDSSLLYERRREIIKAKSALKNYSDMGLEPNMTSEQMALAYMAKTSNQYSKAMSAIRKQEIQIALDEEMTRAEKAKARKELTRERDELAQAFNEAYMEVMRGERDGDFSIDK